MVFTNPEDLINATLAKVNPHAVVVPTIAEQMEDLIYPGRTVEFRTESGSLYSLTIFQNKPVELHKVEHGGPGGIRKIATGEVVGIRDRKRGVSGIRIEEPGGRTYTTSAIMKIWLAYDAIAGESHQEP